jgi:hypothetical protein
LAIVRYVLRLEPLASANPDDIARAMEPVARHYLLGDWAE